MALTSVHKVEEEIFPLLPQMGQQIAGLVHGETQGLFHPNSLSVAGWRWHHGSTFLYLG